MDITTLALFRNQVQVDLAFLELKAHGFSDSDMKCFSMIGNLRGGFKIATIGTSKDDRYADMKSELFISLRDWGIPREDAFLFTEGVRRGGKLAVVFTSYQNLDLVTQILKRHGALDLETRKQFTEEKMRTPSEGLSESPFTKISQESYFDHNFAEWLCEHKSEIGPRSAVKVYEHSKPTEDFHLERNINE